jgi:hypothetical protein
VGKTIKQLGLAGMLFGATALGIGCASFYEDPMFRALYGTPQELLPEFIQSGGYREYKRNEAREEYEKKRVEREKEIRAHMLQTKENNYQNQRQEKSDYERYQELPLIFACGGISDKGEYEEIGKKVIFYPDEKKSYIVAKPEVFKMGKEVVNVDKCLTTNEKFLPHKKTRNEKYRTIGNHLCTFFAEGVIEYGRKHGYSITLWENTWYVDGRKIASITKIYVDRERLNRDDLNNLKRELSDKASMGEVPNNKKFVESHKEITSGSNSCIK